MLPKEFDHWLTINDYFSKWRQEETWQCLNDALRRKCASKRAVQPRRVQQA
jgi:hypothetical protein